ncbi:hypothetical protein BLNAU_15822 [Blattamonas nauphoetae]|uniref:Uncharacterized protein n=1 Tax=Blattamonas nauphoetae TaxID=2049346 RepID=A0ABQ9XC18_9EUKA|nr:hypothetical protein BLNAU_15822 [Blattamonas nauphoetae]
MNGSSSQFDSEPFRKAPGKYIVKNKGKLRFCDIQSYFSRKGIVITDKTESSKESPLITFVLQDLAKDEQAMDKLIGTGDCFQIQSEYPVIYPHHETCSLHFGPSATPHQISELLGKLSARSPFEYEIQPRGNSDTLVTFKTRESLTTVKRYFQDNHRDIQPFYSIPEFFDNVILVDVKCLNPSKNGALPDEKVLKDIRQRIITSVSTVISKLDPENPKKLSLILELEGRLFSPHIKDKPTIRIMPTLEGEKIAQIVAEQLNDRSLPAFSPELAKRGFIVNSFRFIPKITIAECKARRPKDIIRPMPGEGLLEDPQANGRYTAPQHTVTGPYNPQFPILPPFAYQPSGFAPNIVQNGRSQPSPILSIPSASFNRNSPSANQSPPHSSSHQQPPPMTFQAPIPLNMDERIGRPPEQVGIGPASLPSSIPASSPEQYPSLDLAFSRTLDISSSNSPPPSIPYPITLSPPSKPQSMPAYPTTSSGSAPRGAHMNLQAKSFVPISRGGTQSRQAEQQLSQSYHPRTSPPSSTVHQTHLSVSTDRLLSERDNSARLGSSHVSTHHNMSLAQSMDAFSLNTYPLTHDISPSSLSSSSPTINMQYPSFSGAGDDGTLNLSIAPSPSSYESAFSEQDFQFWMGASSTLSRDSSVIVSHKEPIHSPEQFTFDGSSILNS